MNSNNTIIITCDKCSGSGGWDETGERPCGSCLGYGRKFESEFMLEYCSSCSGSGKEVFYNKITCDKCSGSGTIECYY